MVFAFMWTIDVVYFVNYFTNVLPQFLEETLIYGLMIVNFVFSVFVVYDSLTHPELFKW